MATKAFGMFSSGIGLYMTTDDAQSAYHQGQCDEDVKALAACPEIAAQLDALGHDAMAAELRGYGTWSEEELADKQATRERFVWLAAADIVENPQERIEEAGYAD